MVLLGADLSRCTNPLLLFAVIDELELVDTETRFGEWNLATIDPSEDFVLLEAFLDLASCFYDIVDGFVREVLGRSRRDTGNDPRGSDNCCLLDDRLRLDVILDDLSDDLACPKADDTCGDELDDTDGIDIHAQTLPGIFDSEK